MNPTSLPENLAVPAPAAARITFMFPIPPLTQIPTAPTPDLEQIRLAHTYYRRGNFQFRRSVHFFAAYAILWIIGVALCLLGAYLRVRVLMTIAFMGAPTLILALVWAVGWWWIAYETLVDATVVGREPGELNPAHMEMVFVRYLGEAA